MHIRIALALIALLGATGCWIDACEEFDPALALPVCRETLIGPFNQETTGPGGWCGGTESPGTTCDALGYTASCQDAQVRPEVADAPVCR